MIIGRKHIFFLSYFLVTVFLTSLNAQRYPFRIYNVKEGLTQSQVQTILQDEQGYLWIGTRDGLAYFDGKKFINFGRKDGLVGNYIISSLLDSHGNIWLTHRTRGVTYVDVKTRRPQHFPLPFALDSIQIEHIFQDKNDNYWFATNGAGVFRLQKGRWKQFSVENGIADNTVKCITQTDDGRYLIGTANGMSVYDEGSKDSIFTIQKKDGLAANDVTVILKDHRGNIWAGSEMNGITYFKITRGKPAEWKYELFSIRTGLSSNNIQVIYEDSRNRIWIGSGDRGVTILSDSSKSGTLYLDELQGLSYRNVQAIYEDREGSIWIGTNGGGICQFRDRKFRFFSRQEGLNDQTVWSIRQDSDDNYWFGTEKGLTRYRPGSLPEITNFTSRNGLAGGDITSIYPDDKGYLWLAVGNAGIQKFDPFSGRVVKSIYLSEYDALSIVGDSSGNIWVGTNGGGLHRYNPATGEKTTFRKESGLSSNFIFSLLWSSSNELWIATAEGGVCKYDGTYFIKYGPEDGINAVTAISLAEDPEGAIWIGTEGHGLFTFQNGIFENYFISEGLSGDGTYSLLVDNFGKIWQGTRKGIERFNPATGETKLYGQYEGFYVVETNQNAAYRDREGKLWFGTLDGVVCYDQAEDRSNKVEPLIHIERVGVYYQDIPFPEDGLFNYKDNNLTFNFIALSFVAPEKIRYKYILEGLDENWSPETADTYARYTNLPPGEYTFKVKACNNDGYWSRHISAYTFEIAAPFWGTIWFFLLLAVGIGFTIYTVHWRKVKNIHKLNLRLENMVQDRTSELVTEKEKTQEAYRALLASEEKLMNVTKGVNAYLWSANIDASHSVEYTLYTENVEKITGYAANDFLKKDKSLWREIIYPADKEIVAKSVMSIFSGNPASAAYRIIRADGEIRWVYDSATPIKNDSGNVVQVHGVCFDITDRKEAEEALKKSEEKYKTFVTYSTEAIFCIDSPKPVLTSISVKEQINQLFKYGYISDCNDAFARMFGFDKAEDVISIPIREMLIEDDRRNIDYFNSFIESGYRLVDTESVERGKDGVSRVFLNSVIGIVEAGKMLRVWGTKRDITEKKSAEEALRESEERYRKLIELAPDAIVVHRDYYIDYVNQAAQKLFVATGAGQLIGKKITELVPESFLKATKILLDHIYQGREISEAVELRMISLDNVEFDVEVLGSQMHTMGEKAGQLIIRDVTLRKQAENALIEEKERLDVTLSSIDDAVITTDTAGKIVLFNDKAQKFFDDRIKKIIGKNFNTIFQVQVDKNIISPVDLVLESQKRLIPEKEVYLIAKTGKRFDVELSAAPITGRQKEVVGVVIAFRDVAEKRHLESELIKAQKLESIGILAGGIAHDFNNILTAVLGNVSLAKLYTSGEDKIISILSKAEKAVMQAKELTHQLLTFSKGGAPVKKTASIEEIVRESANFILRGSQVQSEFNIDENLWNVEVDTGQMSQVIQNLIINAQQAMPEGKHIKINLHNKVLYSNEIPSIPAGNYVRISIIDEGIGIPDENLEKIFDPYFTTKTTGTGLGLTTTYSIIKRHGGYIAVESKTGVGTTVHIYLLASLKSLQKVESVKQVIKNGKGRILVMDDEPMVRELSRSILNHLGYEVVETGDGKETLNRYLKAKDEEHPIDLIIMDLTIPGGMGGKETIIRLKEIDPEVKAIVSSGYSNDPIMADFRKYGFVDVLNKPYTVENLSHTVLNHLSN